MDADGDGAVRVGDGERRQVDARLQAAVGDGRLTLAEYDERVRALWAAQTRGELAVLLRDLPAPVPPAPPAPPVPRHHRRRRRKGLVLAGVVVAGGWLLLAPAETRVVTVQGTTTLTLDTSAPVERVPVGVTRHLVTSTAEEVTVVVPDGVVVRLEDQRGEGAESECDDACEGGAPTLVVEVPPTVPGEVEVERASEFD